MEESKECKWANKEIVEWESLTKKEKRVFGASCSVSGRAMVVCMVDVGCWMADDDGQSFLLLWSLVGN